MTSGAAFAGYAAFAAITALGIASVGMFLNSSDWPTFAFAGIIALVGVVFALLSLRDR